jgi:hypothetical protein
MAGVAAGSLMLFSLLAQQTALSPRPPETVTPRLPSAGGRPAITVPARVSRPPEATAFATIRRLVVPAALPAGETATIERAGNDPSILVASTRINMKMPVPARGRGPHVGVRPGTLVPGVQEGPLRPPLAPEDPPEPDDQAGPPDDDAEPPGDGGEPEDDAEGEAGDADGSDEGSDEVEGDDEEPGDDTGDNDDTDDGDETSGDGSDGDDGDDASGDEIDPLLPETTELPGDDMAVTPPDAPVAKDPESDDDPGDPEAGDQPQGQTSKDDE